MVNDFIAREEPEWQMADIIICGSEFVRSGIAQCGGPVEKCAVVPVVTRIAGVTDAIITHGENGLLFPWATRQKQPARL